jgi:hypothetical protein
MCAGRNGAALLLPTGETTDGTFLIVIDIKTEFINI